MNKKIVYCPACGSDELVRHEKNSSDQLTLGRVFSYQEIYYTCGACQEEGDFLLETDKNHVRAQKIAESEFVKESIADMSSMGITMAFFERVLELPPRTVTRWKSGDFSTTTLALLRIMLTYPWIVEVAEHKFDQAFSKIKIIHMAAEELGAKAGTPILSDKNYQISNDSAPHFLSTQRVCMRV